MGHQVEKDQHVPKKDVLEQLTVTSSVIKESLRLRGPSPVMYLQPNETLELKGAETSLSVVPDDLLVILNRTMTTSDRYYENPSQFLPERWNEAPPSGFLANLPFGGGPRVCPGRMLSMFESNMFLGTILSQFVVRTPESTTTQFLPALANTEDPNILESLQFTMGP